MTLQERLDIAEAKLAHNKCNAGHETLPLVLWDCPECTQILREERDDLRKVAEASQALLLAYANEHIKPEHKPAWKALIDALKAVRPFLEEK